MGSSVIFSAADEKCFKASLKQEASWAIFPRLYEIFQEFAVPFIWHFASLDCNRCTFAPSVVNVEVSIIESELAKASRQRDRGSRNSRFESPVWPDSSHDMIRYSIDTSCKVRAEISRVLRVVVESVVETAAFCSIDDRDSMVLEVDNNWIAALSLLRFPASRERTITPAGLLVLVVDKALHVFSIVEIFLSVEISFNTWDWKETSIARTGPADSMCENVNSSAIVSFPGSGFTS